MVFIEDQKVLIKVHTRRCNNWRSISVKGFQVLSQPIVPCVQCTLFRANEQEVRAISRKDEVARSPRDVRHGPGAFPWFVYIAQYHCSISVPECDDWSS